MTATVETITSKFLTVTEVGARVSRCERTVRAMIQDGRLKAFRLRGRLVVHEDEIAKYLGKQREPAEPAGTAA